jgi:signal transduction histidine kinase
MVEALIHPRSRAETVAEMAHDARNMVTALGLYCDLLEEPGVLAAPYLHYGSELRLVAAASRRLVEKLVELDGNRDRNPDRNPNGNMEANMEANKGANNEANKEAKEDRGADLSLVALRGAGPSTQEIRSGERLDRTPNRTQNQTQNQASNQTSKQAWNRTRNWDLMPAILIDNLAVELTANRNLLAALAGPSVSLTVNIEGGAMPVRLTGEDLTRVLVNLVKNSAEAMPAGGRVAFRLHEFHSGAQEAPWLVLTVEDTGPGIPGGALDAVFGAGYTTRAGGASDRGNSSRGGSVHGNLGSGHSPNRSSAGAHRGLGLSITRSIVEGAGGCMHAVHPAAGARFEIELPVRQP